jgi:chromosome segregation ATPase
MDKAEISRERLEAVLGELVDRKLEETKRAEAAEAKITELRNLVAELRVELRETSRSLSTAQLRVERLEGDEEALRRELREAREEIIELRQAFDRADDLAELLVDLVVTATMSRRPPEVDAAAARLAIAQAIRAHSLAVPQGAL